MCNKLLSLLAGAMVFIAIASVSVFAQGVTTANLTGRVIGADSNPLEGATIIATHIPSGSRYGAIASDGGEFRLTNMRVGGPYQVVAKFIGFEEGKYENVSLTLGQTRRLVFQLSSSVTTLQEVEITSSTADVFDGNKTGQATVISEEQIKSLPTLTRSIADFARVNPLVQVNEATDGFSFNIAGQNNRYNSIYIDGSINNDQFGLAASGTDGGQTGAGPISLDAIEQLQVSVAPFDVRLSGFAGGAVNVITRSGTNNVDASAYYLVRNQDLAGETPSLEDEGARESLPDFTSETFGFRVGGPIIKDKLFFFINAEARRDEIPEPFDFSAYDGTSTLADLQALRDKLNGFGYDPGTFTNNATTLEQDQFLVKLDWNINQNHKLAIRHLYNDIENFEARNSTPSRIRFENGSEFFPSTTNNTTLEVNSVFSEKLSNQFRASMKFVRDDRDVDGDPFPFVRINEPGGRIEFGGERFSTANRLDQDVFTITNDLNVFLGKHALTIGTQNEFFSIGNLFIRENFGYYQYDSLSQFLNDIPARQFDRTYSQVDNVTGDESDAIAEYSGFNLGFYIQDEFQANDNLKLTLGLRLDVPGITTDVPVNPEFNTETIRAIEAEYGEGILEGARTGQNIKTQVQFAPRFGFNWDVDGKSMTQVRGGIGIFNSRMPGVWFGGAYNNYGLNIAGVRLRNQVVFNPDVTTQEPGDIDLANPVPGGQIDLFAEDFRLPQVLKANIAVDQKLPWGLVGTIEVLVTKNINNIFYKSLNLRPSTESLEGTGDNRRIFNVFDEIDDTYTGIFLGTNTSKGHAYNVAFSLNKNFENGFLGTLSYTFGDAFSLNDGTSSQNNSQWRGYKNVEGRNLEREVARSEFSPGHRVFGSATYRVAYGGKFGGATSFTLTYNGNSGSPYTYTIEDDGFGGMLNDGAFNDENQFYVPLNSNDIVLEDPSQWEKLNAFIEGDEHLSEQRGDYADINASRAPFTSVFDVKLTQEVFLNMKNGKRNTLEFSLDIFNFANMLNNEWGKVFFAPNFGNFNVVRFEGFQDGTNVPIYSLAQNLDALSAEQLRNLDMRDFFTDERNLVDTGRIRSSRWQMQFGIRYSFN